MIDKKCQRCKSNRIIDINGKTSDCFCASYKDLEYDGYAVNHIGIGDDSDYIEFSYCLECGQIQDNFPVFEEQVIKQIKKED